MGLGHAVEMTAELTAEFGSEDWLPEGGRSQPWRLPWAKAENIDSATAPPEGGNERVAQSGLSRFADNDNLSHWVTDSVLRQLLPRCRRPVAPIPHCAELAASVFRSSRLKLSFTESCHELTAISLPAADSFNLSSGSCTHSPRSDIV